ncbi:MAG: matrixin family metalloprotease [Terriglobia bacterium]
MNRTRLLLGGVAILGVLSAAGMLATEFEIHQISSGVYANAMWPGSSPNITWNLNFLTTSTPANVVENGGVTASTVIANSFATWHNAKYNSSSVTKVAFTFGGGSTSFPASPTIDCQNVISFSDPESSDFPTGIIAITQIATVTNGETPSQCGSNAPPACPIDVCIVDADIVFNPAVTFATTSPGTNQFDLQSVATHEIGHLMGLDHSGIANAVMFPYGDTSAVGVHQVLWTDDLIGVSHLYPGTTTPNAGIGGQISLVQSGTGLSTLLYGAHVVAIDAATGNVVTDTLTDPSGNYNLLTFGGTFYVFVQSLGQTTDWGPCTIDNFKGQAGFGNNNFADIPANPTDYTGAYY